MMVIDLGLTSALYVNILIWLPYYNILIGNKEQATLLAFLFPFALFAGVFIIDFFITYVVGQDK